ncbi:FeoB-associated Cys-rich membrane protein [Gemmatimonas sp.]|jgi:FeoB-associated Cys-rich membrane protein
MPTETLVVLLIVAGAAGYVGRLAWRAVAAARKPKHGCGGDCGCGH